MGPRTVYGHYYWRMGIRGSTYYPPVDALPLTPDTYLYGAYRKAHIARQKSKASLVVSGAQVLGLFCIRPEERCSRIAQDGTVWPIEYNGIVARQSGDGRVSHNVQNKHR